MEQVRINELNKFAAEIRINTLEMLATATKGHLGGSLSLAEIMAVLYGEVMKYDPKNPRWEGRDWLVLSKGHCGAALFSALYLSGFYPREMLDTLNKSGTKLPGHVDRTKTPGIDMTAGSLGQGICAAYGIAFGHKVAKKDNYTYCVIGDGESQEGSIWEVMALAPVNVTNFIVICDSNRLQVDDFTDNIVYVGDPCRKAEELGWHAVDCDGHDVEALYNAVQECKASGKPGFINAHTLKGKGYIPNNNTPSCHVVRGLSEDKVKESIEVQRAIIASLNN